MLCLKKCWRLGFLLFVLSHVLILVSSNTTVEIDENGYITFCLCMGRFGNQAEHFIGGLVFAKEVNRTLVLPPWRTYKNIPFTDWFRSEPLLEYHRVITTEDFLLDVAPKIWPEDKRIGYCFTFKEGVECNNASPEHPAGQVFASLGIQSISTFQVSYQLPNNWKSRFPPKEYPVVALTAAPAGYPMLPEHRELQKYLHWSDRMVKDGRRFVDENFSGQKYIGIHLRNGPDWVSVCNFAVSHPSYMATYQCRHLDWENITAEMCLPSPEQVVGTLRKMVVNTGAKVVYIATDKSPYIKEIEEGLKEFQVRVFHQDPLLPLIDIYVLGQSDYFIGNCVSSFSSFISRERTVNNKPTLFWGLYQ